VAESSDSGSELYNAATLSEEAAKSIADQTVAAFDKSNKILAGNNKYSKRLAKLVSPFKAEGGRSLNFKASAQQNANIYSFPNGAIRLTSGLMEQLSDDELVALIAHEIGHLRQDHLREKLQLAFASVAAKNGIADSNAVTAGMSAEDIHTCLDALLHAKYSLSEENEADAFSLDFLSAHHLQKDAEVTALKKLTTLDQSSSYASAHPDFEARMEIMAKKLGGKDVEQLALVKPEESPIKEEDADLGTAPANPKFEASLKEIDLAEANLIEPPRSEPVKAAALPEISAKSATIKTRIASGWYIQIAAETDKEVAEGKIGQLREKGNSAQLQRAVIDDTTYFRILVGPYGEQNEANQKISELGESPLRVGTPFLKRVR